MPVITEDQIQQDIVQRLQHLYAHDALDCNTADPVPDPCIHIDRDRPTFRNPSVHGQQNCATGRVCMKLELTLRFPTIFLGLDLGPSVSASPRRTAQFPIHAKIRQNDQMATGRRTREA